MDLEELAASIANRSKRGRSEATLVAEIRDFLVQARLNLTNDLILDVELEAQLADRRRIDIEMGATVIEVKKSVRTESELADAAQQLAGYLDDRTRITSQRYIGIVTDGLDWHLWANADGQLTKIDSFTIPAENKSKALKEWLAGLLATEEKVRVTPAAIDSRLGSDSPANALELADLKSIYEANKSRPTVQIKRELWAKLLTTALGTAFSDTDELFIEHTFLVTNAEAVAHAVVGIDPTTLTPGTLVSGEQFSRVMQIHGVVEADFFDWPMECGTQGSNWIRSISRRVAAFDWSIVDHDVMKVLYESVIPANVRKSLGEYYTPDFLAEAMIETTVDNPLEELVLDPSCGSGTFLFHAIRYYLAAADTDGVANAQALADISKHVSGMDLHPVAVALARVTYLLAIGTKRLQDPDRGPLRVPVYLGDSLQWGQRESLFNSESLNVETDDGAQLFADQLKFPRSVLHNVDRFERLVNNMAAKASQRDPNSPHPKFEPIAQRHRLTPDETKMVSQTFTRMCELHDQERDHIWGYYIKNLARPAWISQQANRRTTLIGNPPWLSYRHMTEHMQLTFKDLSVARGLWTGGSASTQQDLADLFVARVVEQFLQTGGRFAFVMPAGVLMSAQSEGFRTGKWSTRDSEVFAELDTSWDLSPISPKFFPRTSAVIFGARSTKSKAMPETVERWSGPINSVRAPWMSIEPFLNRDTTSVVPSEIKFDDNSAYGSSIRNGANFYPRVLVQVEEVDDSAAVPFGPGSGRTMVRSNRGVYEKEPWKSLADLTAAIEQQFIYEALFGEQVLPYMQTDPALVVLPLRNGDLMPPERIDDHPGLAYWWDAADRHWTTNQDASDSLSANVNHNAKLTAQFPLEPSRLAVARSGMHVTACRVTSPQALIEHQLNWIPLTSDDEGRYLTTILNAEATTKIAERYMTSGKGGGRHIGRFDALLASIPLYDPNNTDHVHLVDLATTAEAFVCGLEIPNYKPGALGQKRKWVRKQLAASNIGPKIETAVTSFLTKTP